MAISTRAKSQKVKKSSEGRTVVWAVDPLDQETKPSAQAVRSLARWAKESGLGLQPVYIVSMPLENLERGSLAAVDEAQNVLDEFVGEYGLSNVLSADVIIDEGGTRQSAVHELIDYAKKKGAANLALSSHGRVGLKRFVFGSFAENLLREAMFPVLFLARDMPVGKSALFPTDFSDHSRKAFKKFLNFSTPLGLEVVLFHAISLPAPIYASQAAAIPSAYIPESYFPREETRAKKVGAAWIKDALSAGTKARLVLSDHGIGMLSGEVILKAADRAKAGMIAMAAQSGPIDRLLFGSAAHEVFRANRFPVWICGPKALVPGKLTPGKSAPVAKSRAIKPKTYRKSSLRLSGLRRERR